VFTGFKTRWLARATALAIATLVIACATTGGQSGQLPRSVQPSELFSVGYEDISDIYIDDVDTSDLAVAGLGHLSALDKTLSAKRLNQFVTMYRNGQGIGTFPVPAENDYARWGMLTQNALASARAASPTIKAATDEAVYEAIFDGIVGELDQYSRYSSAEEAEENRANRSGFGGIGVRIAVEDQGVRVVNVMEDTPAERAGLQNNDLIIGIGTVSAVEMDQHEVVERLRGRIGSRVTVRIRREGRADFNVGITRAKVVPQTVSYERKGNVAYLRISGFNQRTTSTLRQKIDQAKAEIGPKLAGLVLDLRSNPGGLLDQAVEVSDLFLNHGRIVSTHGRHRDSHQYFGANSPDIVRNLPIVVLINGTSASASEIVAAALQDDGRAVVVGSNSYGKGTVQTVLQLPNNGELTLTWALFYAPSGYPLNELGVLPTICTSEGNVKATSVIGKLRHGSLPPLNVTARNTVTPDDTATLKRLRAKCPARNSMPEVDLQVALGVLTDRTLYAEAMRLGASRQAALRAALDPALAAAN
jgi:carboxyl-terminal processing protease